MRDASGDAGPYMDCGRDRLTAASGEPGGEAIMMTAAAARGATQGFPIKDYDRYRMNSIMLLYIED